MIESCKIIFSTLQCLINGIEFTMCSFKDDLSQNYGEKHFITESGEVAIINFLKDGIPKVFEEINEFIELAWNKVQVNKGSTMLSSYKQDAWRFCRFFSHGKYMV